MANQQQFNRNNGMNAEEIKASEDKANKIAESTIKPLVEAITPLIVPVAIAMAIMHFCKKEEPKSWWEW
jgi:hypothetical protein